MLNFYNLNDIEFEYLCKDIMAEVLGVRLQRFGYGQDGGVDLIGGAREERVIVQVKHYIKTNVDGLIRALKKEIPKVRLNNPKSYYICCSKELSVKNKEDIYQMFSDYMESTDNIITSIEISDFLDKEENRDILKRHFKLWLASTNVLTNILTNNICIDSEVLLADIKEAAHMFVETRAYRQAISYLDKDRVLFIVGAPGVGKTVTSKMLILYYAAMGYKVRYTTDSADMALLKNALSQSADMKEIVLLDDCFGQAYFSMKSSQSKELLALIKYIKMHPNKILVMNSRVTIYREAGERTPDLVNSLGKNEYKAFVLDMSNVDLIEKAKILYNHLFFCDVPQEYRNEIRKNKGYLEIVGHTNYNPRIIEYVTSKKQWESVKCDKYVDFILNCLNDPEQIWKNEYERNLDRTDRILLTTLYSLTNTVISIDILKVCYEHRVKKLQGLDFSINYFGQSVRRLQESMIKSIDVAGEQMISTVNPSVNDFLSAYLERNTPEKEEIVNASICIPQLKRLLSDEEYEEKLERIFADGSVLGYIFKDNKQKQGFICYYCIKKKIFNERYGEFLQSFVMDPCDIDIFEKRKIAKKEIFENLFTEEICSFYGLGSIISNLADLRSVLSKMNLGDAVEFIKGIDYLFVDEMRKPYLEVVESVVDGMIVDYCDVVWAEEYDIDVGDVLDKHMYETDHGDYMNSEAAIDDIDNIVSEKVLEQIDEYISKLPVEVDIDTSALCVNVSGSSELVEAFLNDDYEDYLYEQYREREFVWPEIEYIFER